MSRLRNAALVVSLLDAACDPKPGTRLVVRGEVEDVLTAEPPVEPARTTVGTATLWTVQRSDASVVLAQRADDGGAPTEILRVPDARSIAIEASGNTFALLIRLAGSYRVDVGEGIDKPLRTVHTFPSAESDEDVLLKVGTRHVYVLHSRSMLNPNPVSLVAIPRAGGPIRHVAKVCPNTLAVLDDDAFFVSGKTCPREFPIAQRLEVVRYRLDTDRAETVYAAQEGAIELRALGPHELLLDERIPEPHDEGSVPRYRYRTSRLTPR